MEIGCSRESSDRGNRIVRGAQVRAITKGKPVHLSRPVPKRYPLEIRSEGEGTRTRITRNQVVEVATSNTLVEARL